MAEYGGNFPPIFGLTGEEEPNAPFTVVKSLYSGVLVRHLSREDCLRSELMRGRQSMDDGDYDAHPGACHVA